MRADRCLGDKEALEWRRPDALHVPSCFMGQAAMAPLKLVPVDVVTTGIVGREWEHVVPAVTSLVTVTEVFFCQSVAVEPHEEGLTCA